MNKDLKILFWGTSEFIGSLQHARFLRKLIGVGVRPRLVITAPDDPEKPIVAVKKAALEFGIPVLQPSTLKSFSNELSSYEIDLSLVAAYGKILPSEVLDIPKFSSLNVHPSLLPRWRGPTPIQSTILNGDTATGVTIIQMDAQMDHGPIVAKQELSLNGRSWTAPTLSDALTDLGVKLFLETVEPWIRGKITPQPQNHDAATYCRMLKKDDGRIDWKKPAQYIERMVRAFNPWPGAWTLWPSESKIFRIRIEEADWIEDEAAIGVPGFVWSSERHGFLVKTGRGSIAVKKLTLEGKKILPTEDFLRGYSSIIGGTLI